MSNKLSDYLTKQIFIEKNVVTFRSLSRQFNIHVNTAKRELATFYENTRRTDERSYATYLISGEPALKPSQLLNEKEEVMDVDGDSKTQQPEEDEDEEDDGEVVPQLKMTLAGEQDLEAARSAYARIFSEHVYSLSPSPVLDVGLVCGPSEAVYAADAKLSRDELAVLGRITGLHVQVGKVVKPLAPAARGKEPAIKTEPVPSVAHPSDSKSLMSKKEGTAGKVEEKSAAQKPKPTGKLDFSKAKPKVKAEEPSVKVKMEKVDTPIDKVGKKASLKGDSSKANSFFTPKAANRKEDDLAATIQVKTKVSPAMEPPAKRGVKRKSLPPTDTESEHERPPSSLAPSSPAISEDQLDYTIKGNAILSDDEDEPQPKPKTKGKAKSGFDLDFDDMPSRSARSLKAMMDIDDDEVERVERDRKIAQESSGSADEQEDDDVVMADDSDVLPEKPKRKRKEKKVIPVGKNGLKKKRVIKSRMTTDAKGYMVTEDYSEYESVDEEPEEEPVKPKKSTKAKSVGTTAASSSAKEQEKSGKAAEEPRKAQKPNIKRAGSKVTQQGSLMNFFGKK